MSQSRSILLRNAPTTTPAAFRPGEGTPPRDKSARENALPASPGRACHQLATSG